MTTDPRAIPSDEFDPADPLFQLYREATEPPPLPAHLADPAALARRFREKTARPERVDAPRPVRSDPGSGDRRAVPDPEPGANEPTPGRADGTVRSPAPAPHTERRAPDREPPAENGWTRAKRWRTLVLPVAAVAVAVAVLVAVIWGTRSTPGPAPSHDPRPPVEMAAVTKLVTNEMEVVGPSGIRGPVGPVEQGGQEYRLTFRIETPRTRAVLFKIDAHTVECLGSFDRGADGAIVGTSLPGRFGESEGYELFLVVLVDRDHEESVRQLAAGVTPEHREQLQAVANQPGRETTVRETIGAALNNSAGWNGSGDDILLLKSVEHTR